MKQDANATTTLYMFYVGGNAGRSNIEVHDVQFAAVARVEEAYPSLREAWFGDPDKLHLDGYMPITWVDGHDVALGQEKCLSGLKLFFVNMGGYRKDSLAELHEFSLFVAGNADQAKHKARHALLHDVDLQHKDNLKEVDNCLALVELNGLQVQLIPNPTGQPNVPEWQGYRPIGAAW